MEIKGRNILITAGPTWVSLDKIRVISNISTAKTGMILAQKAKAAGAKVTLLLGPIGQINLDKKIKIKRYQFFYELHSLLKKELLTGKYDAVIHSAAVSDYRPKKIFAGKIKSGANNLKLDLKPTFKIVDKIKQYSAHIFLVMFKLELGVPRDKMLSNARKAMQNADADLCVVNTFSKNSYKAIIIDRSKILCRAGSKERLATKLLGAISHNLN